MAAVAKHHSWHKKGVTCPNNFQLENIGLLHVKNFISTGYVNLNMGFLFYVLFSYLWAFNGVDAPKLQFSQQPVLLRFISLQ